MKPQGRLEGTPIGNGSAELRERVECVPEVAEADEAQDAQTDEEREQPEEKREPLNTVVVVP